MRRLVVCFIGLGGLALSFGALAHKNLDVHDDEIAEGADVQSVVVPGEEQQVNSDGLDAYQQALQDAMNRGDRSYVDQLIRREERPASPTPERVVVGVEELPFKLLDISLDKDQDGLSDGDEIRLLTSPNNPDTDSDGYIDGLEVIRGYNPMLTGPGDKIEYREPDGSSNAQYRITGIRLTGTDKKQILTVTGTGPRNALVVILVFSDENRTWVTRTDKTGRFLYTTFDALDPGNYKVYAASVSSIGESLAFSKALEFERTINLLIKKTEPTPLAEIPNEKIETKTDSVIIIVGAVGVVVILGVLALIWMKRTKRKVRETQL